MHRRISFFSVLIASLFLTVSAAPKIEADKTTIDCGTVIEGKTDKINAAFTIKNTGDEPLKISNVRPGCGCTIVKFDTLVAAGKTSVIQSTVNIGNFHSGPISKSITVQSNASNTPSLQLTISATIRPIIEVSEQYVPLVSSVSHTIVLASAKKDLAVSDVTFKNPDKGGSPLAAMLPVHMNFTLTPKDTVRADSMRVYVLEFVAPKVAERESGQVIIKTNHPDKQEISINSAIEK